MAEKTNSYQDYQDAQSQLLNIQAQQQANLQEARLMGQSQMATNNVLNQAAQVAAQTVAMGNTTQPATFNPTTQAVLQQYGLGQPRVVRNQTRSQSTTPQHVTINNNTSNITNNNVAVPANIGGPLQGRPVQINPDVQMGTFKTWLSNVFAQQNAEAARRDREYEKRESALARNANKVLKKIGEIGGDIGKALDPRRATSSSVNTIKTLFTVLGIANLAKNWDVVAEKLDGLVNFFKGKSREDGSGDSEKSFFVRMRETLVHLLGGQKEGDSAEGVLIALRRLFYTKDGEDSANGKGIFNLLLDRIKIELKNRFEAASAAAKAYRETNKENSGGIGGVVDKAVARLLGATEAIFKSFISMDSSHVINDSMENTADETSNKEINGDWSGARRITTMESKRARKELEANLSYGNDKATFKYNKEGKLLTHENEEAIDLSNININNVVDFGDKVNKNSDLHFDPEQFVNEQGNINIENGDLMGIYLASRDIAINLLRAYSNSKKFSESIQSALTGIKRLDRVFENNNLDRIPIHDDFVSVLSSSILEKLEKRRYKILVRERFKDVNKDRVLSRRLESIGSSTQNTTRYTFVLLPSAGENDKGDYGLTHMLYTVSREDLRDIVNIYTGTDKANKVYDLQSNQFSLNFAKTAYNNTEAKIKDKSEVEAAMAEFKNWYGVNNQEQYQKDLEAWNNDINKSRPKQMAENIAKTEFFNKLDKYKNDAGNVISGKIDQLTGKVYKKKSEFIEKLYEPLNKILDEEFPETLGGEENKEIRDIYTKLLLSQLALESGWGKHQAGNNNLGGIKAPKNSDGTPIDEDHAQQYWTKELLNEGPLDRPDLKKLAKPGFPYQATQNKWMWVIKDYFKTYDTPEDFLKDYVKKLKSNWPEAMEGVKESEDNLPTYFAMKLKNGKKGPYYTANEDSYRDSLKSIYETIKEVQERMANKQKVEEDEISTNSDLESEESQGIAQVRMGGIAEGKGGDDDKYKGIFYNNTYLEDNERLSEEMEKYKNSFNVKKAIHTLRSNTNKVLDQSDRATELGYTVGGTKDRSGKNASISRCAKYVRTAIEAGGINTNIKDENGKRIPLPQTASEYVNFLPKLGFTEVSNDPENQPGDISIEEMTDAHKSGHAAMWDGLDWVSDFGQRNRLIHSDGINGTLHKFRYTGGPRLNYTYIPKKSILEIGKSEPISEEDYVNISNKNEGQGSADNSMFYDPSFNNDNLLLKNIESYTPTFNTSDAANIITEDAFYKLDNNYNRILKRDNPNNNKRPEEESYGMCARHVRKAINESGLNIPRLRSAYQYIDVLPRYGFEDITEEIKQNKASYQKGDIYVEEKTDKVDPITKKKNEHGHMALFNGSKWVSDFIQKGVNVRHEAAAGNIHYFRYTGKINNEPTIYKIPEPNDITQSSDYKKEFEDDFISKLSSAFRDFAAKSRETNETRQSGAGDGEDNTENYKEILILLNQILSSQNSIAYNTAATADEVRTNTEITAQQMNRPIETRGTSNSMLNNRMNSNYGG